MNLPTPSPLDALMFPGATPDSLVNGVHSTEYAATLRASFLAGMNVVYDPDVVLEADPEAYRKFVAELTIAAKLNKRVRKATASGWQVHSKDTSYRGVCDLIEHMLDSIRGFRRSLYTLLYQSSLTGFGCVRISGSFVNEALPGTLGPRNWWLPSVLTDVSKQRWRLHREDPILVDQGMPLFFWAVQDVETYDWHRVDLPGAAPGLRRCDYVWVKPAEEEIDLGYGHGLGRGILHKWNMLTHAWLYAFDGAESWSKGKILVKIPNTQGGGALPGSGMGDEYRRQAAIRDDVANQVAKQMSRHVIVLNTDQEYEVFGRPESGHESVKWMIEKIDAELSEMILGVDTKVANRVFEVDPEIVEADQQILEMGINEDLLPALLDYNAANFQELGWNVEDLKRNCAFVMRKKSGQTPEQMGKSIQIALAAGAPVHVDDIYGGLGLTPVDRNSPHAVFAPQAGQPISGDQVSLREPGSGMDDFPVGPDGAPLENVSTPSPGGASIPQPGKDLHLQL